MSAPGSPRLQASTGSTSSPHAPRFLSTLSPQKSALSTTTVSVTAASRGPQEQNDDAMTAGAAMSRSSSAGTHGSRGRRSHSSASSSANHDESMSLSTRIGSAMNANFPTLASLETASTTVSASDTHAQGSVSRAGSDRGEEQMPNVASSDTVHGPVAAPPAESEATGSEEPSSPIAAPSGFGEWTSRAATGSMSFFRQGVDATAAGLGTALRTSAVPFRSISGAFAGESEAPNAGSSTSASGSPKPASNSSSRPNASRSTSQARVSVGKDDDDDDDDATLVRSAADSLRLGAKNEEKRRRQVQEQTRAQTQQQQRQHPKATAAPPDRSAGSGGGSFFASAGSFLLPSRKPSPTTSRSASPAPRSSSSTNQKQPPAPSIPPDMNCFDFPADWPDAERSPEGGALPSRRYYVLTQAGKPVFLSHLAKRRLAREDAARTRLRQARETQRERDEKLASLGTSTADEEERKRLTSEGEEARKAEEEARRLESLASDQDEEQSAVQVGVLQALVSNFASHGNETLESKSIEILKLPARSSRVVYLLREPLYLAVTSTWHGAGYLYSDSATTLKAHLEVLYSGIVSLISEAQLHRLFARGHNFDLRRMLEGTDGIVESLVARMQADFGLSLGAGGGGVCLRPMRVDLKLREDLTACLSLERWERRPLGKALAAASAAEGDEATKRSSSPSSSGQSRSSSKPLDPQQLLSQRMPARPKDLIYVLLVTPELELVTLVRPRRLSAYPLDLHLLINTVAGMSRRGQREAGTVNWVPICLPRFAPQGMVQAHISWLGAAVPSGNGGAHDATLSTTHTRTPSTSSTLSSRSNGAAPCALVIVTADRESFEEVSRYRDCILSLLSLPLAPTPRAPTPVTPLNQLLTSTRSTNSRIIPDSLHLPGLWHFVLKKKDDLQIVWSEWLQEGYAGEEREAILARERVKRGYERARELCVLRAKWAQGERRRRKKKKGREEKDGGEKEEKEQSAVIPEQDGQADKPSASGESPTVVVSGADSEETASEAPVTAEADEQDDQDGDHADEGEDGAAPGSAPSAPTDLLPPPPPEALRPPSLSASSSAITSSSPSIYTHYLRTSHEAIYVECPPTSSSASNSSAVQSPYEVYLTLSPHVPPATAKRIARAVLLWGLGDGGSAMMDRTLATEGGTIPRGEKWRLWLGRGGSVI